MHWSLWARASTWTTWPGCFLTPQCRNSTTRWLWVDIQRGCMEENSKVGYTNKQQQQRTEQLNRRINRRRYIYIILLCLFSCSCTDLVLFESTRCRQPLTRYSIIMQCIVRAALRIGHRERVHGTLRISRWSEVEWSTESCRDSDATCIKHTSGPQPVGPRHSEVIIRLAASRLSSIKN